MTIAAVVVATWNGNWFPSGRAEHRAHPDVEDATITAAAEMLADGFRKVDPVGTNDWILCLNEIRGPKSASNLVTRIGRAGLVVNVITDYRRRDRFDMQQDVIASTLPVAEVEKAIFPYRGKESPPRGYAYAALVLEPAKTSAVYAVHLKSNYGATTDAVRRQNRIKRHRAVQAVVQRESSRSRPVVFAGDFNADRWKKEFADEEMFRELDGGDFSDVVALLPPMRRWTHPSKTYGNSALDHIYLRGFAACSKPVVMPNLGLSDHFAVFTVLTP